MVENIVAGVLMAAAALAGVWVLWRESSGKKPFPANAFDAARGEVPNI